MTLDVYRGRKTTMQQQQQQHKLPWCVLIGACELIRLNMVNHFVGKMCRPSSDATKQLTSNWVLLEFTS